ncbi:L-aspartate aminotransferase apoenzyme /phosphoserine aminotransferase apoenzyme [Archaeoglobus sulfaticallidus PM70-1]|uniref:L-aspartate aminotransferase apoenzyme /phosphoserine aminotransferase apoenzyme n=1 Tax=Archaeoglobus sulfaticallidus PM70-1 TaxID=387631 RepID=N0BAZ8_9EURY|nr:alanine--glyoxylate aminotransferase family protein [Archaeoglobus sulfaticallidus]AGK60173.1 L-aspartate aminotransferase apoenzyme /phosphoserine aminotransferase apoenzyme [Archaeoglobus sulfaticallidus PM70-1]
MKFDELLMIPGPVQVHSRILNAMAKPLIGHRTPEFSDIMKNCTLGLKELFGTDGDVYLISGSGTAGMEAAISSFSKVSRITCIDNGKFGDRLCRIASRYTEVDALRFEWGESIDLEKVKESLENGSEAVAFVHNETSTGILNPAREIAKIAKKHSALVIMDGITSVGGDEVKMDEWGIDVAIVGSQKCLGIPPGLAAVAVNERAWEFYNEKAPFYLDLMAYKKKLKDWQTPYTPAVPLFVALNEAIEMIKEEGLENRIQRHRKFSRAVREWAVNAGLELFPRLNEYSSYSNTVTAIKMPEGITDKELRGTLKQEYSITISGGQEHLKGKIFRIGTMGNIGKREVVATLMAVEDILTRKGCAVPAINHALEVLK